MFETLTPVSRRSRERRDPDQPTITRPHDLDQLLSEEGLSEWIANELTRPGAVLSTSNDASTPLDHQASPALTVSEIAMMVGSTLREASTVIARIVPAELQTEARVSGVGSEQHARLEQGARLIARLVAYYWAAVRDAFPAAWGDRDGHVLWSGEGHIAFSRLAAEVIEARVERHEILPTYFDASLATVAARVSLARADRALLTAHPVADQLYADLVSALRGADASLPPGRFASSAPWDSAASAVSAD